MAWLHWPEGEEGPEGWLATGSNDTSIKIIDLNLAEEPDQQDWTVMKVLRGHEGAVHSLTWLPKQGEHSMSLASKAAFTLLWECQAGW